MTDIVYVTSHGRQYHNPERHYMTGSVKAALTPRRARELGYEPCAHCFRAEGRRPAVRRDGSPAFREAKGANR